MEEDGDGRLVKCGRCGRGKVNDRSLIRDRWADGTRVESLRSPVEVLIVKVLVEYRRSIVSS